jgi:hypothetical protein
MGLREHTRPLLDVYAISKVNRPTRQSAVEGSRLLRHERTLYTDHVVANVAMGLIYYSGRALESRPEFFLVAAVVIVRVLAWEEETA